MVEDVMPRGTGWEPLNSIEAATPKDSEWLTLALPSCRLERCFTGNGGSSHPLIAGRGRPVIDAHLHCFAGAKDAASHITRELIVGTGGDASLLLKCMEGAGDHAIVVHPEPSGRPPLS
jgi:hypothetical protein